MRASLERQRHSGRTRATISMVVVALVMVITEVEALAGSSWG